ncbi:hypothetical protein MRX96_024145 [Rhipicephalus microplus]
MSGAALCRRTLPPRRDVVRPAERAMRRDRPFLSAAMLLSIYLIASTCSLPFVASAESLDLVPNLCRLMDQPLYCRCDSEDIPDDATEVSCYVTRPLTADHPVFKSFQKDLSLVSLSFNAFNLANKLTFVPSEALRQLTHLERLKFTQSELGVLKTRSFYNLSKLAWLSLDSNAITELENESIAQMPRLKRLELGDNKLSRIPAGALRGLPALAQLFLERNEIKAIEDLAFEELTGVKEVDLSDNAIENLTDRTFKGLSSAIRLDLFRNKVQRLEARVFSGMPQLVELDLKYNGVTEVDPLAFHGLPQLSILYLSHNRLRILPAQMFMGAPNLDHCGPVAEPAAHAYLEDGPGLAEDRLRVLRHEPHRQQVRMRLPPGVDPAPGKSHAQREVSARAAACQMQLRTHAGAGQPEQRYQGGQTQPQGSGMSRKLRAARAAFAARQEGATVGFRRQRWQAGLWRRQRKQQNCRATATVSSRGRPPRWTEDGRRQRCRERCRGCPQSTEGCSQRSRTSTQSRQTLCGILGPLRQNCVVAFGLRRTSASQGIEVTPRVIRKRRV